MNPGELSQEDIDALLGGAEAEAAEELAPSGEEKKRNVDLLMDVPLKVRIELGRRKLSVEDILTLGEGSVVELDKLAAKRIAKETATFKGLDRLQQVAGQQRR